MTFIAVKFELERLYIPIGSKSVNFKVDGSSGPEKKTTYYLALKRLPRLLKEIYI